MYDPITPFLISIGINPTHLTAGAAGSFVRSLLTKGKSRWEVLSGGLVGMFCAAYLTPIVVQWFNFDAGQISSTNGIAFGVGMIGMSLAEGAVRLAQRWANNPRISDIKKITEIVNDESNDKDPNDAAK
ncbi:hypothetical protein [Rhizobium sp.]|uniref:hypothetical protein n=1 Tax=Rhizobium sp. TaxID=391 RepID=UPI0034C5F578